MSAFENWFIAQHGGRPAPDLSEEDLRERVRRGREAESILDARTDWDHRRQSALYAWSAKDSATNGESSRG